MWSNRPINLVQLFQKHIIREHLHKSLKLIKSTQPEDLPPHLSGHPWRFAWEFRQLLPEFQPSSQQEPPSLLIQFSLELRQPASK